MRQMLKESSKLYMRRSGAIAVLVRLERSDVPIPHSKTCRKKLIEYLAGILSESADFEENMYIKIDYDDIGSEGEDLKSAIDILKSYEEY